MNERNIGKRLELLRYERGFSKTFIAEKLSITVPGYQLMESGHNIVTIDHIIKLSTIYGVTTDYLLKGIESSPIPSDENSKQFNNIK